MSSFLGIDTEVKWVEDISSIPILGHLFMFVLIFVPAVLLSFSCQAIIPALHNDIGFTKAMLVLLPLCNLALWLMRIKAFILFIPSWIFLGTIAIIKAYLMYKGIDNGQ
jgi:hypothetical protein